MADLSTLIPAKWTIASLDPEVALLIEAQFPLSDGLDVTGGQPTFGTASSAGSAQPVVQWSAGGSQGVKLSAQFSARDFLDDLTPKIDALERLKRYDPALGRAPRVLFSWGERVLSGFAKAVEVRIMDRFVTGLPRSCSFTVEIVGAPVVVVETVSPVSGETQYVRLVAGDTFEALGARYLGNPLRGELIRRRNPEILGIDGRRETAGDRVQVLEADHPAMRAKIKPSSVPFLGDDWRAIVQDLGNTRGTGTTRGLPWRLLPEVLSGEVGTL